MQSFLEKAEELNALKFGDFTLKSGIKSKYFFDISKFFDNSSLSILSKHYVELIIKNNLDFNCMFGPAYKGIPLTAAVSLEYFNKTGRQISLAFDRKEAKLHGEGGNFIGNLEGKQVLIIDDVLTAGTAIKGTVDYLKKNNATLVAALVAFDREEKNKSGNLYKSLLTQDGINIYSIAKFSDLDLKNV